MNIYAKQPYTYFMFWKRLGKKYYGCQFSKKAAPINVLIGKYKSSSKYVKRFWDIHGAPDCIVIHRVFDSAKECRDFESWYLKRAKVVRDQSWLNMTDNHAIAPECSGGAKAVKYSHASRKLHMESDEEFANHIRAMALKNLTSEAANIKRAETFKRTNHSQGERNSRFGVTVKGTDTGRKISEARKLQVEQNQRAAKLLNQKNFSCEHCGKAGLSIGNYKRWHSYNCRVKDSSPHSIHDVQHETLD